MTHPIDTDSEWETVIMTHPIDTDSEWETVTISSTASPQLTPIDTDSEWETVTMSSTASPQLTPDDSTSDWVTINDSDIEGETSSESTSDAAEVAPASQVSTEEDESEYASSGLYRCWTLRRRDEDSPSEVDSASNNPTPPCSPRLSPVETAPDLDVPPLELGPPIVTFDQWLFRSLGMYDWELYYGQGDLNCPCEACVALREYRHGTFEAYNWDMIDYYYDDIPIPDIPDEEVHLNDLLWMGIREGPEMEERGLVTDWRTYQVERLRFIQMDIEETTARTGDFEYAVRRFMERDHSQL